MRKLKIYDMTLADRIKDRKKTSMQNDLLAYVRNGQPLSYGKKLKLVATLSLPAIMAQLTSIMMQYIDASMVGRLGADAAASIGLVATTTWLFGSLSTSVSTGFSIQVAQYVGAKEYEKARRVLHNSYPAVLLLAAVLAAIGIGISGALPGWLGGTAEIQRNATWYFRIYSVTLFAMALNSLAGSMLQCSGNMKIPGLLDSLMCVLDVVLNFLFIYVLKLGVVGAALGTALAVTVVTGLMLFFLWRRTPVLQRQREEHYAYSGAYVKRAIRLSLPIAFEHLVVCGAMVAATRIVAPIGIIAIAANSFAVTAESLCYMPGYGIADAATTLVGQSVGAGRKELAWSFGRITVCSGMLLMAVMGGLMYFLAPVLMSLLTENTAVCELGVRVLRIEAFAEPLYGASIVCTGVMRGAGDTLVPSVMNFVSLWCVRLPLSYLLAERMGLEGIWLAMCAELCFRGTVFLVRLVRRRWLRAAE